MSINNIERRVEALESEVRRVNDCPECKDFNISAYSWNYLVKSDKHIREIDIPEYQCLTCGKVPTRTEKEMQEDYGKMIVDFHAGRPIWRQD